MTASVMDENFNWDSAYLLYPSSMGNTKRSPTAYVIHAQTLALLTLALNRSHCVDGGLHSEKGYAILHRQRRRSKGQEGWAEQGHMNKMELWVCRGEKVEEKLGRT